MIPYIIKSFRGGVSDESDKGIAGAYKFGYGMNIRGRDDVLTGKQAMSTLLTSGATGTTQNAIISWLIPATNGTVYAFGATGSIFTISGEPSDPVVTFVYNDENGGIKGANEFRLSDGTNYMWWATGTSIARKPLEGVVPAIDTNDGSVVRESRWTDVTADYWKLLDPSDYHTMTVAAGELMIANNNYLASIDYTGVFNPAAMDIRPGNIIKAIEERDDYVILGSYRKDQAEEGHIWSWITTATNWVQKKRIPVKGVNALINTEMLLLQGGDDGELFFSDFVNAVPLHGIYGGGKAEPGGTTIEDDVALFGIYGGTYPGIYSYGHKRKNQSVALNYDYRLAGTVAGSTISTVSAVTMANGLLLASWGTTEPDSSIYGIDCASSTTKASVNYEGLEFDGGRPYLKKFFDTVILNMAPLPIGTSVSVKFKLDKDVSWKYAFLGSGSTVFSEANATEAIFSVGSPANVYEVGVELNPTGNYSPEILGVTTYLSEGGNEHG